MKAKTLVNLLCAGIGISAIFMWLFAEAYAAYVVLTFAVLSINITLQLYGEELVDIGKEILKHLKEDNNTDEKK